MIVTAIVNRPQEVIEGLRRDASRLPPRRCVREAEMNPHVDASVDHVIGQIREAMVGSLIRHGLRGIVVTLNVTLSAAKKRNTMVVKEPDRLLAPDV